MQQLGTGRKRNRLTTIGFLWGLLGLIAGAVQANDTVWPGVGTLEFKNVDERAVRLATDVEIEIVGHLARTRITQRFQNPSDTWVTATYLLPLPDRAAVDTMELLIDETRIVGEIKPKVVAERTFREAEQRGQKAALVSEARPNLFNTAVSNIPPLGEVTITIEYQETVARDGDRYRMRLPLTLTPRFNPGEVVDSGPDRLGNGWVQATHRVPDAPRITPTMLTETPDDSHRLTLSVRLLAGTPLAEIVSDYHWIDVTEANDGEYLVSLANDNEPLDHDFSLSWMPAVGEAVAVGAFHHEREDQSHYLSLQLIPPTTALGEAAHRELILVIDTSGSMQGVSIEQARSAVQYAISELRPSDRFNVIAFNDQPRALFASAQLASDDSLRQALRWVNALSANGGTNMQPALAAALGDSAFADTSLRQVIFVTDGAVGDEAMLFRFIEQSLGQSRLFTVGIGSAPNGWFMRKAAEVGRGQAVTISALGEVEERMRELFGRLGAPTLTDLQTVWSDGGVQQLPETLPDLYAGEPINLAAKAQSLPRSLKVTGTLWRDGIPSPWSKTLDLQADSRIGGRGVGVSWARRQIEALIDDERRNLLSREQVDSAITEIALDHHIVTRTTSLVAVAAAPLRPAGEPLADKAVPNLMPYGQSLPIGTMVSTATAGPLHRLIGYCAIILSLLLLTLSRWQAMRAPDNR
ncbi:MAG: marine proteobacterial sortase target protein [Pseudomonadota bacterium]